VGGWGWANNGYDRAGLLVSAQPARAVGVIAEVCFLL
jgi:hypothetical protein